MIISLPDQRGGEGKTTMTDSQDRIVALSFPVRLRTCCKRWKNEASNQVHCSSASR